MLTLSQVIFRRYSLSLQRCCKTMSGCGISKQPSITAIGDNVIMMDIVTSLLLCAYLNNVLFSLLLWPTTVSHAVGSVYSTFICPRPQSICWAASVTEPFHRVILACWRPVSQVLCACNKKDKHPVSSLHPSMMYLILILIWSWLYCNMWFALLHILIPFMADVQIKRLI